MAQQVAPMVYLDHCATTPLAPEARVAIDRTMDLLASGEISNASSVHTPGRKARAFLNDCRSRVATAIGARPAEIVLTSSGSESVNLAIKGAAFASRVRPFHIVVSAIEHDCVLQASRWLAERFDWIRLVEVLPDSEGIVDPSAVDAACAGGASLVCVMAVNNETGAIQPTAEIAEVARRRGALFLCDAVQAPGRLPLNVADTHSDLLALASHKVGGPRGAGLLWIRPGARLDSLIHGGHQEGGRRAGTESLELIAGFAAALETAQSHLAERADRLRRLERHFLAGLQARRVDFVGNGPPDPRRAPGVLNLSVRGVQSADLVVGMDLAGFAIASGAACSSGVIERSHVLHAMGLDPWRVEGGVRVSFGHENTEHEASAAAEALANLTSRLLNPR